MAGDHIYERIQARWSATGADTDGGGVTVTRADPGDGKTLICTGIQCSGDAAAIVTVESPASTILYRKRFAAAFNMSEAFAPGALVGAASEAMLVKISAGTTNTEANIQGFTVHSTL